MVKQEKLDIDIPSFGYQTNESLSDIDSNVVDLSSWFTNKPTRQTSSIPDIGSETVDLSQWFSEPKQPQSETSESEWEELDQQSNDEEDLSTLNYEYTTLLQKMIFSLPTCRGTCFMCTEDTTLYTCRTCKQGIGCKSCLTTLTSRQDCCPLCRVEFSYGKRVRKAPSRFTYDAEHTVVDDFTDTEDNESVTDDADIYKMSEDDEDDGDESMGSFIDEADMSNYWNSEDEDYEPGGEAGSDADTGEEDVQMDDDKVPFETENEFVRCLMDASLSKSDYPIVNKRKILQLHPEGQHIRLTRYYKSSVRYYVDYEVILHSAKYNYKTYKYNLVVWDPRKNKASIQETNLGDGFKTSFVALYRHTEFTEEQKTACQGVIDADAALPKKDRKFFGDYWMHSANGFTIHGALVSREDIESALDCVNIEGLPLEPATVEKLAQLKYVVNNLKQKAKLKVPGGTRHIALELFSGTGSVGKVLDYIPDCFTVSVDISPNTDGYKPTVVSDILKLDYKAMDLVPTIIWASPPCQSYSVAAGGKHRTKDDMRPKTPEGVLGLKLLNKTVEIIQHFLGLNPSMKYYLENPDGLMKYEPILTTLTGHMKMVSYCKYGFDYRKNTCIYGQMITDGVLR